MLAGMSGVPYDPEHIARFYDEYGAREWDRFDLSSMDRVGLEVHLRLLRALAELLRVAKPGGSHIPHAGARRTLEQGDRRRKRRSRAQAPSVTG